MELLRGRGVRAIPCCAIPRIKRETWGTRSGICRTVLVCLSLLGWAGKVVAAPPAPDPATSQTRMSFDFSNPALSPASYHLEFDSSGVGHYHSEPGSAGAPDAQGVLPQPFDQQIEISSGLREQLLALVHSRHFLAGECDSRQHKVAFTGAKTIGYMGPEGNKSCTFNWSPDAQLMKAASAFIAVAETLEQGRRLRLAYLHDRLSLDAELETLINSVRTGTALELENIAPELQAIASDPAVMKRAQARAQALLAMAASTAETALVQGH